MAPGQLEKSEPGRVQPGRSVVGVSCKSWPQPLTWNPPCDYHFWLPAPTSVLAFCHSAFPCRLHRWVRIEPMEGTGFLIVVRTLVSEDAGTERTFGAIHMDSLAMVL